jgi:hypothetical protein
MLTPVSYSQTLLRDNCKVVLQNFFVRRNFAKHDTRAEDLIEACIWMSYTPLQQYQLLANLRLFVEPAQWAVVAWVSASQFCTLLLLSCPQLLYQFAKLLAGILLLHMVGLEPPNLQQDASPALAPLQGHNWQDILLENQQASAGLNRLQSFTLMSA